MDDFHTNCQRPIVEFDRPVGFRAAMLYLRALRDIVERLDLGAAHVVSVRVRRGRMFVQGSNGQRFDVWVQPCDGCPPGKRMLCPYWLAEESESESESGGAVPTYQVVPCPCAGSQNG